MIHSVLVPLDGSPFAEHALPWGTTLARRADARLLLARVHEFFPPADGATVLFADQVDRAVKERERAYLDSDAFVADLRAADVVLGPVWRVDPSRAG